MADSCVQVYARDPPTALTKTSLLSQMHDVLRKPSPGGDYLPGKTPDRRTAVLTAPVLPRVLPPAFSRTSLALGSGFACNFRSRI